MASFAQDRVLRGFASSIRLRGTTQAIQHIDPREAEKKSICGWSLVKSGVSGPRVDKSEEIKNKKRKKHRYEVPVSVVLQKKVPLEEPQ